MTPTKGKHGGARPGAGRKKSPPVLLRASPAVAQGPEPDSIRVLRSITIDESLDVKLRLDAAKALAPFEALRKGDGGKKDEQAIAAKKASVGRFAPSAPPLSVVK